MRPIKPVVKKTSRPQMKFNRSSVDNNATNLGGRSINYKKATFRKAGKK